MKAFRFKIEDYINPPHFILVKGKNHFQAVNIVRNMFPLETFKITFIGNENNLKFS